MGQGPPSPSSPHARIKSVKKIKRERGSPSKMQEPEYMLVSIEELQEIWHNTINDSGLWWYIGITSQGLSDGVDAERAVKMRGSQHSADARAGRNPNNIFHTDWIPGDLVDELEGSMVNDLLTHPRTFNQIAAGNGHNNNASHGVVYLRVWIVEEEPPVILQMDGEAPPYEEPLYDNRDMEVPHCKHMWCSLITGCIWAPFWACACCGCSTCRDPCPTHCECCYSCCVSWIPRKC